MKINRITEMQAVIPGFADLTPMLPLRKCWVIVERQELDALEKRCADLQTTIDQLTSDAKQIAKD